MVFRQGRKCPHCGNAVDKNANFCDSCGKPLASGTKKCPFCGTINSGDAKFCENCGKSVANTDAPRIQDNRWRRDDDDFATRITVEDVRGFFSRDFIVEPGTQAIVLANGASLGVVGPGSYTLDRLMSRLAVGSKLQSAHEIEIIVVDTADSEMVFSFDDLVTQDLVKVKVVIAAQVEIANPMRFFQTMMRSQRSYSKRELQAYLTLEVEEAAANWAGRHHIDDLRRNYQLKREIEQDLEMQLGKTGERNGLRFVRVRAFDLKQPVIDRVSGIISEAAIANAEEQAKLDAERNQFVLERERLENERTRRAIRREGGRIDNEDDIATRLDVLDHRVDGYRVDRAGEEQTTLEMRDELKTHMERLDLWERMQDSLLGKDFFQLENEEKRKEFLLEVDKNDILRGVERQSLLNSIAENEDDRLVLRSHLLAKTDIEREFELKQILWLQDTTVDEREFERRREEELREYDLALDRETKRWRLELAKMEHDGDRNAYSRDETGKQNEFEWAQEDAETDASIKTGSKREDYRREQAAKDAASNQTVALTNAETMKGVADIDREVQRDDAELGMDLARQANEDAINVMKTVDHHELDIDERKQDIALDGQERQSLLRRSEKAEEHEQALESSAQMHNQDLEREDQQNQFLLQTDKQKQDFELGRIERMANASAEAVMSLSDPQQAALIAELKSTEALKGMSDSAVESLMASKSPQLADAIAERYRAMANGNEQLTEQQKELYERLLAERDAGDDRLDKAHEDTIDALREAARMQKEMGEYGMRMVHETSRDFANRPHQPIPPQNQDIVVVTPNGNVVQPTTGQAGTGSNQPGDDTSGRVQVCPNCLQETRIGTKFCSKCGYRFFKER